MDLATADIGESCKKEFYTFLTEYEKEEQTDPTIPNYSKYQTECLDLLRANSSTRVFRVDFTDVDDYDIDLGAIIVDSYVRVEPYLNEALRKMVTEMSGRTSDDVFVAFYNLTHVESLRGLRGDHIGQLTSFAGRVTRTGEVRPELYLATFTCLQCGAVVNNVEQEFKLTMPTSCSNTACSNKSPVVDELLLDGHV